jgi:hypothetical protein
MVVPINVILFTSVVLQALLMPFRNKIHNYLEIVSLMLNFLLFDVALFATSSDEGSVDTLSLVLDLVRVAAFVVLGGYGVYENRGGLVGLQSWLSTEGSNSREAGGKETDHDRDRLDDDLLCDW